MLVVEQIDEMTLSVQFNYCTEYVNRIRQIPNAWFHQEFRKWIVPISSFNNLETVFKGELVYQTPKWVITKSNPPDYSKMYQITNNITVPVLNLKPYPYQNFGIKFMIDKLLKQKFIINADGVGLGKTIQAIGTMKYFIENANFNKILIVCKKSLKQQWVSEINKFTNLGNFMFIERTADKKARDKLYKRIPNENKAIIITNYHTVMNDTDILKKLNFDMVILDEVHYIKSRTGVMNKAVTKCCTNVKKVILLTGTPIMDKPDDLYGIVKIADSKYFGKWSEFEKNHIKKDNSGRYNKVIGYRNLDILRDMTQNIIIRRTEHEVALELPNVITKRINVELDKTQNEIQIAINKDRAKILDDLDNLNNKIKTPEVAEKIAQKEGLSKGLIAALQACANDPRLFEMSKSMIMKKKYAPLVSKTYKYSSKTETMLDIVEDVLLAGEKIIIFTKFERCCRLIENEIIRAFGVTVVTYTGQVCDEDRDRNIYMFVNDPNCKVLVANDAAAEGLNLQVANHVINFDLPYTPAIYTQRMGRARRVGSRYKKVYVYDLLTDNSYDNVMLNKLEKATTLFNTLITADKEQSRILREISN